MKNYTFAISEYNFLKYFKKNDQLYFILNNTDLKEVENEVYKNKFPNGRGKTAAAEQSLRIIFLNEVIRGFDEELTKYFIDYYLKSNVFLKNSFVAIKSFGEKNFKHEIELLIDIIYCICENQKDMEAVINYNGTDNMSVLNIYRKPTGISKYFNSDSREHIWSLPIVQIDGYVADNFGIILKLKNNTYAQIGKELEESKFNAYVSAFQINLDNLF
jgi:hypothetical protein